MASTRGDRKPLRASRQNSVIREGGGLLFLAKSPSRGAGAGGAAVDKQSTVDRQKYGASR